MKLSIILIIITIHKYFELLLNKCPLCSNNEI